jgi:hypothetical protein
MPHGHASASRLQCRSYAGGAARYSAAARYDASLRIVQWFEHYLLGPGGDPLPATVEYP